MCVQYDGPEMQSLIRGAIQEENREDQSERGREEFALTSASHDAKSIRRIESKEDNPLAD